MIPRILPAAASFAMLALASCSAPKVMQPSLVNLERRAAEDGSGYQSGSAPAARVRQVTRPSEPERTGLATGWGKTEKNTARATKFERDNASDPLGVARLYYNDAEGAAAMTGGQGRKTTASTTGIGGRIRLSLTDAAGRVLPALQSGGVLAGIGQSGDRWVLEIENLTNYRLELVTSVDGLDVIDGRPAAATRRGYVTGPGERIQIKGWRTGMSEVAAFSFSTASESYARKRHGDTRNIGVVGCAVFNEKGTSPVPATETARTSDPMLIEPGETGFAAPPVKE